MTDANIEALMRELEALKKENEYLKVLDSLPPVQATDMWGQPRAPLTDEDRKRFREWNRRNGGGRNDHTEEESKAINKALADVAKRQNLRDAIDEMKKKNAKLRRRR